MKNINKINEESRLCKGYQLTAMVQVPGQVLKTWQSFGMVHNHGRLLLINWQ